MSCTKLRVPASNGQEIAACRTWPTVRALRQRMDCGNAQQQ